MAILIDPPRWSAHDRLWSHLVSDTSYEQLHAFAAGNGIPARGFDGDHYDVPQERYAALVAAGALEVEGTELARRLRASGLRFPKRRGERPLATGRDVAPIGLPHRVDLLASPFETPDEATVAAVVFVRDVEGALLLVHTRARDAWGAPGGGREAEETVSEAAVREVAEESGLALDAETLRRLGYERFIFDEPARLPRWPHRRCYVAVFATDLAEHAPAVAPGMGDVDAAEWVDAAEAERRCRDQFWWPLLSHHLG